MVAMTSLPSMKVSTATSIRHVTIETVTHVILFLKNNFNVMYCVNGQECIGRIRFSQRYMSTVRRCVTSSAYAMYLQWYHERADNSEYI